MVTFVVRAHPLADSYCAALSDAVCVGLDRAGRTYRRFDIAAAEHPGVTELAECDQLILVYPTWWGGQPASLLTWLRDLVVDEVSLSSVGAVTAVTSCGSTRLLNRIQGEWGQRYLKRRIVPRCAPGAELEWLALYKIDRQRQSDITRFLRGIEHHFADRKPSRSSGADDRSVGS